ncbi:MAG: hypothetical protein L6435_10885, partial [Anaerolineae bacterium]|nr:hypothetical protein [Anaerolineae bacterium]
MLDANGVMFNWQSDWNFLLAVGLYDTGTPETNGKNLVRYIKEDLGFEVDPHAHETLYNYADVACLIEALGVTVSHTAGGFLAAPTEDSKLEYLWQPITGTQYPTYTWQAEILWGGATLFHIDEQSLWVSGIWKPKDTNHFVEHDAAAPLPYVGGYGRNNCDVLIEKQQNGELEEENIHTCTLFVGQTELLRPGFVQQFEQQIQALDTAGNIRWVGLAEVIDIWKAEYGEMPNILRYSNESTGNLVVNGGFEEGSGGEPAGWTMFSPGPPGATFEWDSSSSHDGDYSVRIDAAGTEIGMWQQIVDITPDTVYSLSGYVAFESIVPPGYCNLEVVFRDSEGHVLQFVDLPEHDGTRPFELDFPYDLKFRAP